MGNLPLRCRPLPLGTGPLRARTLRARTLRALPLTRLTLRRLTARALPVRSLSLRALPVRSAAGSCRLSRRQSACQPLPGLGRQAERLGHAPPAHRHSLSRLTDDASHAIDLDLYLALDQHDHCRLVRLVPGERRPRLCVQQLQSL